MLISHSVMPPGGWVFTTEKGVKLVGETFDLLKKNIISHKLANMLPLGDVEADIENQYVQRFPHLKNPGVLA